VGWGRGGFFQFHQASGAVELDGGPEQPVAESGADPAGEGAGGGAIVLFGGGGTGFLSEGWGEQSGGLVTEEDFREGEVAAGGFVADEAHRQRDGAEGGEPMEGAPALDAEAVAMLGRPSVSEGGEGLEVELASGGVGGLRDGGFQVVEGKVATGSGDGGRHGDGAMRRLQTRLSHTVRFG